MSITDPLTVSIDDHLQPITKPPLEALEVLWQGVRQLPISDYERRAMQRLLGSGSTDDLERMMNGDEVTDWTLGLQGGGRAIVRVSYGDGLTCRQRVAARYVAEKVERGPGLPERWVVKDRQTGYRASDTVSSESAAREWIRRQVQNANFQSGPARKAAR